MTGREPLDFQCLNTVLALASGESETAARELAALEGERFIHWCQRQQIGGLTYLLLEDFSRRESVSRGLLAGLRGSYLDQWARTERLRVALAELAGVFAQMQEPFLVLKGLAMAHRFYGGYHWRATGDLDILLPRDRAQAVADALEQQGFTRLSPRYRADADALNHVHHVELAWHGSSVELHHALRVHSTFRIDEARVWKDAIPLDIHEDRYLTLSDPDALLLHLLGFHTDVQIGQVNARWFVDLHQMLLRWPAARSWPEFLNERRADGTFKICVNSLAAFVVIARSDEHFPALSQALAECREDIVLPPNRLDYLDLVRGSSLVSRKTWPLQQYEGGVVRAASWWLSGLPQRIAAKPAAFAGDVTSQAERSPWEREARPSDGSRLEHEFGIDPAVLQDAFVQFGSLRVRVRYERADQLEALEELYRLGPTRPPRATGSRREAERPVDLVLHLFRQDVDRLPIQRVPCRPLVVRPLEQLLEIHEGTAHAWIDSSADPVEAFVALDRDGNTRPRLLHSLMVVVNRLLSAQGRYHVHAAAVGFRDAAALFVGGKGAGKSTISLSLGRAGATVFSEDHVMLREAGDRFLVSGCDAKMHLTQTSEQHFFQTPVEGSIVQSAGISKKRIDMAHVLTCRPFEEVDVTALFFPGVGQEFAIRPFSKEDAVARMLAPLAERHRFVNEADQEAFLAVFCRLVESVPTWELTLSPDLHELARLADFLKSQVHATPASVAAPLSLR